MTQTWSTEAEEFKGWMRQNVPPPSLDEAGIALMRTTYDAVAARPERPYTLIGDFAGQVPVEWVLAPGSSSEKRLLMPHGGAFVSGSKYSHRGMAYLLSEATGYSVLIFEHRLAPEHRAPAALDDSVTVYEWMLQHGPEGPEKAGAICVGGDSAGGNLSLALLLRLRDEGKQLPSCAFTMSIWADMTCSGGTFKGRTDKDAFLNPELMQFCASQYVSDANAKDPYISPMFGDFANLPPILLQVGDHEILLDDSRATAARIEETGGQAILDIWPGMFHTWQFWADTIPEAKQAVDQIAKFIGDNG